jgi:uncharacterized iron-regulated membrane protein
MTAGRRSESGAVKDVFSAVERGDLDGAARRIWLVRHIQLADGRSPELDQYSVRRPLDQITDSFEPLHLEPSPVKILWCLGGLAPGVLAITGYILWWKRKRPLAIRGRPLALLIEEQSR